ncbi:MAG: hypothetical protein A2538_01070 [Candidatus Magasanikbacteria bacterium RIFOXYD2_FULL_41_14]|uniref:Peptidase M16 n=1 Tax=Candidatus Magasanikbacteria bacterium RIFOXYD2_FULL_41_14 TaxID=1798709 RepID=A0A1F6PDZ9_9BACT|nr:MAG: hypothetical protein A2538_01070 [Candidatus Magasanikbacteria bacterium RIFOXYD2_FULL_41_14]
MHEIKKLKNGLQYIYIPNSGTSAVTVLLLFPIGSRYETRPISGISHFLEHMLFKGTKKRPDYLAISRELDAAGADYNAFTYKDYTGYYVKIGASMVGKAFDIISDISFNSTMPAKEVEKEKGVIVEELRMYEDSPMHAIELVFDRLMFPNHPLGWDVGGNEKTVRAITRAQLLNYYHDHYSPQKAVLVVAGNLSKEDLEKNLEKFALATSKNPAEPKYLPFKFKDNLSLSERVAVQPRKIDQVQMIMGFHGVAHSDKRSYAAAVLLTILGGGMSSRLFVEVREKRGLAYMVRAGSWPYRDVGSVYVQAGLDPKRLPAALRTIKVELKKIATKAVSKKELADAKTSLVGRMDLALEDSSVMAERAAKQFIFLGDALTAAEVARRVNEVTAKDVLALAKELFKVKEMHLAVIGPVKKEDVLKMLKNK